MSCSIGILRCLSCFTLFGRRLSDGDGPQKPVVGVDDPLPGDSGRVDVQVGELLLLLLGQRVGVGLVDAELLQTSNLKWESKNDVKSVF